YDPIKFKQILKQNESKLTRFFDELVEGLIPKTRSFYNQEETKKSIISFCYLFASLRNKFANSYKLDIGLHLASARTSYRGIDILSNTGLTVSSKTVLRYKQQFVKDYFEKICKYFNNNVSYFYLIF
ncbi:398_t:CDS:1, partial [Dentiscutata heterogama]